jgi:uncharacterized membrane protein YfcA
MARMPRRRTLELALTGTLAGVFSGLFGVGGGAVMVPLLVVWMGFDVRAATGTSLAAIVVIAGAAVVAQAGYGNVRPLEGVLVGVPAIGGVLLGTSLQQRLPRRVTELAFAAFLVVTAVLLALR